MKTRQLGPLDEDLIEVKETSWYQAISKQTPPGESVKLYRELRGWTQAHLGDLLGGVSRQNIHNLEAGRRAISKDIAKKLATVFEISVERFI